jgi:hypothetical protein
LKGSLKDDPPFFRFWIAPRLFLIQYNTYLRKKSSTRKSAMTKRRNPMRRRFGRLALAVGALAVIAAWVARQRKATDAIRESYETARDRFETARERLSERVLWERGQETGEEPARDSEEAEGREQREGAEGHRAYFRKVIEESNKRASGKA